MSEGNANAARLSAVVFSYPVTQRIPRGISLSCWQWWLAQQLCHYAFLSFPSLMFSSEAHLPVFCGSICLISYKTQAQDLFLRLIQNKAKVAYAVWTGMNGQRWEQRRKEWEKVLQAAVPAPVKSSSCCHWGADISSCVFTVQTGTQDRAFHGPSLGVMPNFWLPKCPSSKLK